MKKMAIGSIGLAISLVSTLGFAATPVKEKAVGKLSETGGSTEFLAIGHPSALKVVGKGASPKGEVVLEPGNLHGKATFDLQSLDTGIGTRNEHMKEKYLEVGKYPESSLEISKLALPAHAAAADFSASGVPFEGKLTLHGVEKPVSGTAELKRSGSQLDLLVHFGLKISDFGIPKPGYAGITMADEVQVTVKDVAVLASSK